MKTTVGIESFEASMGRLREHARKLDSGEPLRPERRVIFESAEDMLACLTPERLRLLRKVREQPLSVTALAAALERDRKAVHRDVQALHSFGLLRLHKTTNPGHGQVQMVTARARRLQLRAEV